MSNVWYIRCGVQTSWYVKGDSSYTLWLLDSVELIYVQCFAWRFNITAEENISVLQSVTQLQSSAYSKEQLIKFLNQNDNCEYPIYHRLILMLLHYPNSLFYLANETHKKHKLRCTILWQRKLKFNYSSLVSTY